MESADDRLTFCFRVLLVRAITVTVNLYTNEAKTETTYIIPGPPLYGSGSGSPAPPPPVRVYVSSVFECLC